MSCALQDRPGPLVIFDSVQRLKERRAVTLYAFPSHLLFHLEMLKTVEIASLKALVVSKHKACSLFSLFYCGQLTSHTKEAGALRLLYSNCLLRMKYAHISMVWFLKDDVSIWEAQETAEMKLLFLHDEVL